MNELREKIEKKIEKVKSLKYTARHSGKDYFDGEINALQDVLYLLQSQPINKELEKWKKDHKDLLKLYMNGDDQIKELEKENDRLKTLNKINSISKPSDWEKDALHRQLEAKDNQITQLQKNQYTFVDFLECLKAYINTGMDKNSLKTLINQKIKSLTNKTDEQ